MSLDGDYTKSVDKSSGDDLASEMRTILKFIKSIEARQVADDAIQNKKIQASHRELQMSFASLSSGIDSITDFLREGDENIAENAQLGKAHEALIAAQEKRISSQEQHILALEEKLSLLSARAKTG